jgi:hypothetical protein
MIDQDKLEKLAIRYVVDMGSYEEDHELLRLLIHVHNLSREEALSGNGQTITFFKEVE